MWPFRPKPAPLPQQKPEPSNAAIEEQLEIFRRSLKRFEGELDDAMDETRALHARMRRALDKAARPAQDAPEPTNAAPEGVQGLSGGPRPLEDLNVQAARIRKAQQQGQTARVG